VKLSLAISDLQVHLYGDTAIVTYQRQIKQFASSEGLPAGFNPTGRAFTCMDTFVKRSGEWRAIANAVVSQSSIPDEVYKAVKTEAARLPN
jgi:ketosteroid isomerase-like protein